MPVLFSIKLRPFFGTVAPADGEDMTAAMGGLKSQTTEISYFAILEFPDNKKYVFPGGCRFFVSSEMKFQAWICILTTYSFQHQFTKKEVVVRILLPASLPTSTVLYHIGNGLPCSSLGGQAFFHTMAKILRGTSGEEIKSGACYSANSIIYRFFRLELCMFLLDSLEYSNFSVLQKLTRFEKPCKNPVTTA